MVKLNLNDVELNLVPNGTYKVKILSMSEEETENSEYKYLAFDTIIIDNPEFSNRHIFINKSLNPKALWSLKQMLMAMGFDVTKTIDLKEKDLKDKELKVVYSQEKGVRKVLLPE